MSNTPSSSGLTRRAFLGQAAVFAAGVSLLPRIGRGATSSAGGRPSLVKRVVRGIPETYFTYTHCNAFMPDGHTHVVARGENKGVSFFGFEPNRGEVTELGAIPGADLYYSISDDGRTMAESDGSRLLAWDVGSKQPPRVLIHDEPDRVGQWHLHISEIARDGRSLLTMRAHKGGPYRTLPDGRAVQFQILKYDLTTDKTEVCLEADWFTNHVHYSPCDPKWISIAHEGDSDKIHDRLWAWNAVEAPDGRRLFDQGLGDHTLYVGHERAVFDKPAVIFVAFGASPGRPTGLYEVDFQGRSRLVSEGPRDWHCNISRDGTWAVVDTTGPHDAAGRGWANSGSTSDVVAINTRTGARCFLHRSSFTQHPYHPHPHISPDGRWVILNDAKSRSTVALEIDQAALKAFLEG